MRQQKLDMQKGFTLVEIAIVLVIIGLLLGGVLKGQEMIENGKIKNLANDLKGVATAYTAYVDRYKAIPGDDILATTRFTGATNGGGNGVIAGNYNATANPAAAAESNNFWQHVRLAGFMGGTGARPPTHSYNGFIGIQQPASTFGITGPVVCAGSVPWKAAQAVDVLIDDGDSATGSVRAGASSANPNANTAAGTNAVYGPAVVATAALEAGLHTLCMKI